jgi:1,4-alpha-glucan branching enzyme
LKKPPYTASVVWDLDYKWDDAKWRAAKDYNALDKPYSVYEVHLGSWNAMKKTTDFDLSRICGGFSCYVKETGFTHVEFMPIMEYPYDPPSWGIS